MTYQILLGDCIETMRGLPDACVQTCVTSPPYYGLRDYGTAQWEGGDDACDHVEMRVGMSDKNTLGPNKYLPKTNAANVGRIKQYGDICGKCGARRIDNQIGLEETPDAYVAKLVDVFREVRRLLKDDGTLWLNLGDSYASSSKGTGGPSDKQLSNAGSRYEARTFNHGVKDKDLIGIPWMVAFALRADGWWLRSDIIWHKPNPMPESVTDRPTKAHEYIFLLSKSAKYYYDADAVREPHKREWWADGSVSHYHNGNAGMQKAIYPGGKEGHKNAFTGNRLSMDGANKRSVWTVTTKPYSGAHFATFPPDLIEPCILAGSARGDTVLDPFNGSGTTGAVALKHGREYIGCELNPDYIDLAHDRISKSQPTLLEVA